MYKKQFTCLMIKTQDKKIFFTYKTTLKQIIEYVKKFKAKIYLVKAYNVEVLQIKDLAIALCSKTSNQSHIKCEIIEKIFPISIRKRVKILKDATKIRDFITKKLKKGDTMSLQLLKKRFKMFDLTDSCLCNHLAKIRKDLNKQGHNIRKIGPGEYQKPSRGS